MKKNGMALFLVLCCLWFSGCEKSPAPAVEESSLVVSANEVSSVDSPVTSAVIAPQTSSVATPSSPISSSVISSAPAPLEESSVPSLPQEESQPEEVYVPVYNTPYTPWEYFDTHEYHDPSTKDTVTYLFHEPESTQEPLPLVIFLHGKGDSVSESYLGTAGPMVDALVTLQSKSEKYQAYVLVPSTPFAYEGDWTTSQIETFKALLPQLLEEYNIDPLRIYLSGISMGGFMTCRLVSEVPNFFAAAVPLSGSLLIDFPQQNLGTAFRIYHVATDSVVSVSCSRQLYEQLQNSLHPNVKYVEYEFGDHISPLFTVFEQGRQEFFDWLFAQRLDQSLAIF